MVECLYRLNGVKEINAGGFVYYAATGDKVCKLLTEQSNTCYYPNNTQETCPIAKLHDGTFSPFEALQHLSVLNNEVIKQLTKK